MARSGEPQISKKELYEAEYFIPEYNIMVKLKDGTYEDNRKYPAMGEVTIWKPAFGDLNNDKKDDAVLILSVKGIDSVVIMLNKNGKPSYLTQKSLDFIGRGSSIDSIAINSGIITVGVYMDAGYRQTRPLKIFKYKLSKDQLVEVQ